MRNDARPDQRHRRGLRQRHSLGRRWNTAQTAATPTSVSLCALAIPRQCERAPAHEVGPIKRGLKKKEGHARGGLILRHCAFQACDGDEVEVEVVR